VILFHADDDEVDDIFEVLTELARDLRHHKVYKLVIGKINMNKNEPSEHFKVHSYPTLYLLYKGKNE
jgi:hypothetical protein